VAKGKFCSDLLLLNCTSGDKEITLV